jgi:hypothetical protein
MAELSFTSKLTWSGGSQGVVETGGQSLQFSVPASMGGLEWEPTQAVSAGT